MMKLLNRKTEININNVSLGLYKLVQSPYS